MKHKCRVLSPGIFLIGRFVNTFYIIKKKSIKFDHIPVFTFLLTYPMLSEIVSIPFTEFLQFLLQVFSIPKIALQHLYYEDTFLEYPVPNF
jgi:hypothetical protein